MNEDQEIKIKEDKNEIPSIDYFFGDSGPIKEIVRIKHVGNPNGGEIISNIIEQNDFWNVYCGINQARKNKDIVGHVKFDYYGGTIYLFKPNLYSRRLIKILGEDQFWAEVLAHESLHIVIYKVAGPIATHKFDNLQNDDGEWEHDEIGYVMPKAENTWYKAKEMTLNIMKRQVQRSIHS